MKILKFILLYFAIFTSFILAAPVDKDKAFEISLSSATSGFEATINIDKSVYLYADKLKFYANSKEINAFLDYPKITQKDGENVILNSFKIFIPLGLLYNYADENLDLLINYQGCSLDGFCYSPLQSSFKLNLKTSFITPISLNTPLENTSNFEILTKSNDEQIAASFNELSAFWVIVSFFGYGLLLSFTPCVLPMLPVLSAIIIAKTSKQKSLKTALLASLSYVLAMALTNAIFGVIAASAGSGLNAWLQSNVVIIITSAVFAILGLLMFLTHNFKIPNFLNNFVDEKIKASSGYAGIALMGALSALVLSPCVAAPLAGALLYIANSADILLGGLALFFLGLGMGAPLIALGFGVKILPRPGEWMVKISQLFGFIMLGFALWMLSRIFDEILIFAGILCVFAAVILGAFDEALSLAQKAFKAFCVVILIFGAGFILLFMFKEFGSDNLNKISYPSQARMQKISTLAQLNTAIQNSQKPVIAEFWASWCVNCKNFEKEVLSDSEVKNALENFTLIKVDVSKADNASKELLENFKLFGPPALIFYENKTQKLKITGEVNKMKFLEILNKF